jgi:hypothetical protein
MNEAEPSIRDFVDQSLRELLSPSPSARSDCIECLEEKHREDEYEGQQNEL